MDITISQFIFFFASFLTPLVLQWYRLRQAGPVDYRQVFASSIEIIFASTGFIYTLVEKNSTNQILYVVTLIFIFLALGFEKDNPDARWKKNIVLMLFTVGIPFYLLFFNGKNTSNAPEMAVTEDIEKLLRPASTNSNKIREMCGGFLSGTKNLDEQELSVEIRKLAKTETEEMYLALSCLMLQRKDTSAAENYLSKVGARHLQTDKNFILFNINRNDANKNIAFNFDTPPWTEINNQKIIEIKEIIKNLYKQKVRVLILDASGGRGSRTTSAGLVFKNRISEFKSVTVARFDYSRTTAKNFASSGFFICNPDINGVNEVAQKAKVNGIPRFGSEPGSQVKEYCQSYDIVIVVNK